MPLSNKSGVVYRVVLAGIVRTIYLDQAYGSNLDKTWLAFNVVQQKVI
jgi:hypothetical protein